MLLLTRLIRKTYKLSQVFIWDTKPPLHPLQLGWPRILLAIIIAAHTDTPLPVHPLPAEGVIVILTFHALVAFPRP